MDINIPNWQIEVQQVKESWASVGMSQVWRLHLDAFVALEQRHGHAVNPAAVG